MRAGVPYRVVGGVKFYDRREVKDVLAYLRALVNPDDEVSWKRIVNTPKRGVGDTSVEQGRRRTRRVRASRSARRSREAAAAGVTGKALGGIRDLLELMADVRGHAPAAASRPRSRRSSSRPATSPSSRPSARSRRRAASRTCRSSSASCREFDEALDAGDVSGLPGDRGRRHATDDTRRRRRRSPPASRASRRSSRRSRSSPTSTPPKATAASRARSRS